MVRRGLEVGGAGREQRRCGLAGASARQKMTRGLAVIPVLQRSKQRINDRRAPGTTPMPHRVNRTGSVSGTGGGRGARGMGVAGWYGPRMGVALVRTEDGCGGPLRS